MWKNVVMHGSERLYSNYLISLTHNLSSIASSTYVDSTLHKCLCLMYLQPNPSQGMCMVKCINIASYKT